MSALTMQSVKKVAVIGAGAAGMVTAHECYKVGLQVIVFEKERYVGGVWKYYPGSIMYNSLRTNLPKEIMAFNHENTFDMINSDASYLTHDGIQAYLEIFSSKHGIYPLISFDSEVTKVYRTSVNSPTKWTLHCTKRLEDGTISHIQDQFDAVIVCNGHYNTPNIPTIPGIAQQYKGKVYHSKNYDSIKDTMHGKSVLVVGARSSGTDMARELRSVAKIVYVSDRNFRQTAEVTIDDRLTILPALQSCDEDGSLRFAGMTQTLKIDVILFCTGYLYEYPFLFQPDGEAPLIPAGRVVRGLYQHLFRIEDEGRLCFVGLPWSVVPFPLSYLQAKWIALVYSEEVSLPSKEEQHDSLQHFEAKLDLLERYHYMGTTQWEYMRMIARQVGLDQDERYMRHLHMAEEIYNDNSAHRPSYVGAPDVYRDRKYIVDKESMKWTVVEPDDKKDRGIPFLCIYFTKEDISEYQTVFLNVKLRIWTE